MKINFNFDRKNVQIGFQNQFIIENFTNNLLVKILPGRGPKGDSYVLEEEDKQEIADIVSQQVNTELDKYKTIYNVLPKVSSEGTDIELKDTGNAMLAFNSFNGYTSQKTTTGKNLFDKDNQVKVQVNSGGTLRYGIIVDAPNKKVSISAKSWNNSIALKPLINGSYGDFLNINSNTTLDVVDKLIIYATSDTDKLDLNIEELQVEINDVPTDYEPYTGSIASPNPNYPQPIKIATGEQNIKIQNKNLFDKNNLVQGYISDTIIDNRTNTTRTNAILLKAGTYTYSFKCTNSTWIKMVKYANVTATTGTFIFNLQSANYSKTFTLSEDTYVRLGFDTNLSNILANATIQIEFSSIASNYLEHQLQTYPLSLGNRELAKIGNYKDYIFKNVVGSPYYNADLDLNGWYLYKIIDKITLSNSDSFTLDSYSLRFTKVLDTIYEQEGYSNRYIYGGTYQTTGKFEILSSGRLAFNYPDSNIDTVAELRTYLTANELYMYLPLATPTYTEITDTTLIQQLENINNNARSYKDTTIITCSSESEDNETIQASVTALKDISTLFEQVNNAIIEIGGGE